MTQETKTLFLLHTAVFLGGGFVSFIAIAGVLLIFSLDVRYRLGIALIVLSVLIQTRRVLPGKR